MDVPSFECKIIVKRVDKKKKREYNIIRICKKLVHNES